MPYGVSTRIAIHGRRLQPHSILDSHKALLTFFRWARAEGYQFDPRILERGAFETFLKRAVREHGVHRVMLIGGDEPQARGPFNDSLEVLASGVLSDAGVREIG